MTSKRFAFSLVFLLVLACSDDPGTSDTGGSDGSMDATTDTSTGDSATTDTGADTASPDSSTTDSSAGDTSTADGGDAGDAGGDGGPDCSVIGCGAPIICGGECDAPCGCCPCGDGTGWCGGGSAYNCSGGCFLETSCGDMDCAVIDGTAICG